MVNISRRKVDDKVLIRLNKLFFEILYRANSVNKFISVIDDLFSPKEKIMIAKRIGILYLVIKRVEQKLIADKLKVSTTTVSKFALIFSARNSPVVQLIKELITKEKGGNSLEDIFAEIFIQPGIKRGHWKIYHLHEQNKERKKMLNE